jgi:hypothetical protein
MPSLNLKTGKINYSKADLNAIQSAITLLKSMAAHDPAAKKEAEDSRSSLAILAAHIANERKNERKVEKPAAPKPEAK